VAGASGRLTANARARPDTPKRSQESELAPHDCRKPGTEDPPHRKPRHDDAELAARPLRIPHPSEFSNWGDEQATWQHTAVLFDQSFHMTDVYFRGSNLKEFFATIAVNSFATFGPDKAKQLVMVNPDGYVIADGILFGLGMEEFSLAGRPAAPGYAASWS
jgi:glycine cleavage system aminomethyltransferase T